MYPKELKYLKTHEWLKTEGDIGIIGITSFAVDQVKDIVFLELPAAGKEMKAGSPFGTLESVKAVFDLNSPVSGKVIEANAVLNSAPETVSKDPYKTGWMIKVKLAGDKDPSLMDAETYEKSLQAEGGHH